LVVSGVVFRGWWQGFFQNVGVRLLFIGVVNLGILGALRNLIEGEPAKRDRAAGEHGSANTEGGMSVARACRTWWTGLGKGWPTWADVEQIILYRPTRAGRAGARAGCIGIQSRTTVCHRPGLGLRLAIARSVRVIVP